MKKRIIGAGIVLMVLIVSLILGDKVFGIVMTVAAVLGFKELVDIKYKNMANEILNRKIEERKEVPSESEISKMLDNGYELEIYATSNGCIRIEGFPSS